MCMRCSLYLFLDLLNILIHLHCTDFHCNLLLFSQSLSISLVDGNKFNRFIRILIFNIQMYVLASLENIEKSAKNKKNIHLFQYTYYGVNQYVYFGREQLLVLLVFCVLKIKITYCFIPYEILGQPKFKMKIYSQPQLKIKFCIILHIKRILIYFFL